MAKRVFAGFLVAAGVWACGAGDDAPPGEPSSSPPSPASNEAAPNERDVPPVARYRFVDTSDGMTIEATTDSAVTTFSCRARSCGSLCDECAAQACGAAGELSQACSFLVRSCNDSCTCDVVGQTCGFPACTADRMLCYIGDDATSLPGATPGGPTDPSPISAEGRPSESGSNAARPSF